MLQREQSWNDRCGNTRTQKNRPLDIWEEKPETAIVSGSAAMLWCGVATAVWPDQKERRRPMIAVTVVVVVSCSGSGLFASS